DWFDLSAHVSVERKMNLDELCQCYTKGRARFEREFARAAHAGAKVYLLVEDGNWEKALSGDYRSRMAPKSLVASMTAWLARYNCQLLFCAPETSGILLKEILFREGKERLCSL
ncbi:MAG: ERCC4 domain-containing protein, partial [Ruthenibacterium sp.]